MTALKDRKTRLAFTTEDTIRYRRALRRVVVEVDRHGMCGFVRLEGTRTRFPFSFGGLYDYAVKNAVARAKAEKAKGRKK
jgi:hypothetical protein